LLDKQAQSDAGRKEALAVYATMLVNQVIKPAARQHIQQPTTRTCLQQPALLLNGCAQAFFW
jgi:hypothetical protein